MSPEMSPQMPPQPTPTRSPDRLQLATQWIVLGLIALAWVGPALLPTATDREPSAQPTLQRER